MLVRRAVSDPGARAVEYLRRVGRRVIPVPGASAAITALSAAGLLGTGFDFIGFLPPQPKARHQSAAELAHRKRPSFSMRHRIVFSRCLKIWEQLLRQNGALS